MKGSYRHHSDRTFVQLFHYVQCLLGAPSVVDVNSPRSLLASRLIK